jgi:hypothetical protein
MRVKTVHLYLIPTRTLMKIIGAGFGRTGTLSLKKALEILGFCPCYHMKVSLYHPWQLPFWVRAKAGEKVNWKRFFRKYEAAIDWPACEFYRELMHEYPDARVILTLRDPEEWYESISRTLYPMRKAFPFWFPKSLFRMQDSIIWQGRFQGKFEDKQCTLDVYKKHIEEVIREVPSEQLLIYHVRDAWEPLCRFLEVSVPIGKSFPHLNDTASYRRLILLVRLAGWLVPIVCLGLIIFVLSNIFSYNQ